MKANRGQIERALDAPPSDIRLFLLYGPDESGSAALAKRLERSMGPGAERIDLDSTTLKSDPARLSDEAASLSMFGDKRWIRIAPLSDDALPAIEALLESGVSGNPVVAIGGAMKATSKLLKRALDSKAVMACASYVPEGRDADQLVMALGREQGLRIAPDMARRLSDVTSGDRTLMAMEIEKLCLYLDAAPERPKDVTHEAITDLIPESSEENVGALVNAVLGGDVPQLAHEMAQANAMGANVAGMLRGLLIRATMLAAIRAEYDRTGQLEAAMDSAGRAIFWKDRPAIQRQVRLWDAERISRAIQRLGQAERDSRSRRNAGTVLVAQELLTIARQASRAR